MGAVNLKGQVVGFRNNKILAVVKTKDGNALLDINDVWHPQPQKGDEVEMEDGGFYISNGVIISFPEDSVWINGKRYDQADH